MNGTRALGGLALAWMICTQALAGEAPFEPPAPAPDDFDWIRLVSGEWLKGDIKYLRDRTFEFKSKKLETLQLEWKDVVEVRSPRMNVCRFTDGVDVSGTLLVRDGFIFVGSERHERAELQSIVAGAPTEATFWSAKATLGITASSGNTDQSNFNTYFEVKREDTVNRFLVNYTGNYNELNGTTNTDNHRIAGGYRRDLSRRLFLELPTFEFLRDPFQNIDLRSAVQGGAGYRLIDNALTSWTVSASGGYRRTSYDTVEEGTPEIDDTGNVHLATSFERDLAKDTDLTVNYTFQISTQDSGDRLSHLDTIFSTELVGPFDIDLTFVWDRVNQPVASIDHSVPKKDDFRSSLGLSVDF